MGGKRPRFDIKVTSPGEGGKEKKSVVTALPCDTRWSPLESEAVDPVTPGYDGASSGQHV